MNNQDYEVLILGGGAAGLSGCSRASVSNASGRWDGPRVGPGYPIGA